MAEKQSRSKAPLSVFKSKLSFEVYIEKIKQLVPNLNKNAHVQKFIEMHIRYLDNFGQIENTSASRIKLNMIGFFSATQLNSKYWTDRGWDADIALEKIKKRQSTCTPEIAKKIQETLSKKTEAEMAEINKRKGNGMNADWLVKNKGLSRKDAEQQIFERCSNAGKMKNALYKKLGRAVSDRQLNFYLEQGLSLEDAKIALKERQSTTSLYAYVKKYGQIEGLQRYEKRIKLFRKSWQNKTDEERLDIVCKRLNKNKFFSAESYNFFQKLEKNTDSNLKYLYGKNEYFLYDLVTKKIYFYDFVILEEKMIIEYHGSFWHANPIKDSNDWKNPFYSYEESLQKDSVKKRLAEEHGFSYFIVWDYQQNDAKTIETLMNIKQK
jgi:hypothetical protein